MADSAFADARQLLETELPRQSRLPPVFNPGVLLMGRLMFGADLSRNRPVDAVARLGDRPLLLIHGELDSTIPLSHHKALERAAAGNPNMRSWVAPGAEHVRAFKRTPRSSWRGCWGSLTSTWGSGPGEADIGRPSRSPQGGIGGMRPAWRALRKRRSIRREFALGIAAGMLGNAALFLALQTTVGPTLQTVLGLSSRLDANIEQTFSALVFLFANAVVPLRLAFDRPWLALGMVAVLDGLIVSLVAGARWLPPV